MFIIFDSQFQCVLFQIRCFSKKKCFNFYAVPLEPLRWGSKLEPSLLPLIRVIGYTKILLYAIFV